eukprot:CAMPEP_0119005732 /NCGR_PEP_ID=MMETSP1176-20130426/1896_1 /TAXON_ID=265551 /ORGANISM="Synedropsis recta cf, Strain CCMP1620" /LENGTH=406 /DNA_ID=CAMNT_0006957573 /DNA_START=94 /DNA_END=1314 /DNA_ORIENTATION=+
MTTSARPDNDAESRSLFEMAYSEMLALPRSSSSGKSGKGKGKGGGKGGDDDDDGSGDGCGDKGGKGKGGKHGDDDDDDGGAATGEDDGCDEEDDETNAPPPLDEDAISFEKEIGSGTSIVTEFCIPTAAIPQNLEVCLLSDASGSFVDDQANLRTVAEVIASSVLASSPDAKFGYAAFTDTGDAFVYRLFQPLSTNVTAWTAAINSLQPFGGGDSPEAQYDGIACAVDIDYCPVGPGYSTFDCGFSSGIHAAKKVLIVTTDDVFSRDADIQNTEPSVLQALAEKDVVFIGLKAGRAGNEMDVLAAATGGSTEPLTSSGNNIAEAILTGLESLTTRVAVDVSTCTGFGVTFDSLSVEVPSGQDACFQVTLEDTAASPPGTELSCIFDFSENDLSVVTYSIGLTVVAV